MAKYMVEADTRMYPGKLHTVEIEIKRRNHPLGSRKTDAEKFRMLDLDSPDGRIVARYVLMNLGHLSAEFLQEYLPDHLQITTRRSAP